MEITEFDRSFARLGIDLRGLPEAIDALSVRALDVAEAERNHARYEAREWRKIATMNARRSGHWKVWALVFALWASVTTSLALGAFAAVVSQR